MNTIIKSSIYCFIITLFAVQISECSENFAGDFLSLGSGSRALGMGSTFVAVTDGATSSYYNPAGLAHLKVREINLMHSEQFGGLENYNTISMAAPLSENMYGGISLIHLGVGNIKYTRLFDHNQALSDSNKAEIASREDAADYALYLSGAKRFTDTFSAGASIKIIRRTVGPDTAFGYGIDLGLQYHLYKQWNIGISMRDITGTAIAWDGKSNDRIAPTMDAGLAYRGTMPYFDGTYVITASMLFFGDTPDIKGIDTMNVGFEYIMGDLIAFRAGSSDKNAAFGMGLMKLPLISSSTFDYAFLSHSALDDTHRISMTIRF